MSGQLSDREMNAAAAFVAGEMEEDNRVRFQLELCRKPELADAVAGLMDTDEMLRREKPDFAGPAPVIKPRAWRFWVPTMAAAALILAFALPGWLAKGTSNPVRVALMEGDASIDAYLGRRNRNASGAEFHRGIASIPEGFPAAQDADFELEVTSALTSSRTLLRSAFFRIPIEVDHACSVVVLAHSKTGTGRRLFPREGQPVTAARLAPGRYTLPRPPLRELGQPLGSTSLAEFDPGFVVRRSEEELHVLVTIRVDPLTEEDLRRIDALIASPKAEWEAGLARDSLAPVATLTVSPGP